MATRADIIKKAFLCIDEVYPDGHTPSDIEEFHVEDFVDDAARFVGRVAPIRALGQGTSFTNAEKTGNSITLPEGFVRLIAFKMSDWALPVSEALYSDSPRYRQQADPILKGSITRPIVFICNGGTTLEYYSSAGLVQTAQAFVVSSTEDYPEQLGEAIAWRTAELVLSAMNDAQAVQFAQGQLKQVIEAL